MDLRASARAATAGLAYFVIVFACAFALGALRVSILIPKLGETAAVLIELPILLALSWMVCRWLVERFAIPTDFSHRLVMGGLAFTVLMVAEFGTSVFVFGRPLSGLLQNYRHLPAMLGLAGQIAFATLPVIQCHFGARKYT